jgi:hypothetical protein
MRFSITLGLAALVAAAAVPGKLRAQNTAPVAVQLPTGDYLVSITPADSLPGIAGDWHIVFEPTGTYRVLRNGGVVVLGEYRAVGDTLRLVDKSGDMSCDDTAPASYIWKALPDGSLTLVAMEDPCAGRKQLTTLRALVKAKTN